MNARAYNAEDFETVKEWAARRGLALIPQVLSPNGFVIEDENGPCAVCWVYLIFDVPMAVIDNFFTRPGLGASVAAAWRSLFRLACDFLKNLRTPDGEALGYRLIRTYCCEDLAPFAKREGWEVSERHSRQITYALA